MPVRDTISPALRMAVLNGLEPVLKRYLAGGGSPGSIDHTGRSLLWLAAARGHTEICRLLIEAGADPEATANDGTTVLDAAKNCGSLETLELLHTVTYRASISSIDSAQPMQVHSGIVGPAIQEPNPPPSPELHQSLPLGTGEAVNAQLLEWLEEPEPEMLFAKPEDGDVEGALAIQSRINESQLIDLDADWGDVEIHFLTVRKGRVSLSGLDEGFLRHVSGMLAYGLEAGTVSGSWVQEACAAYEGDFEFDEVELRVRLLLGELGIVDEEWFWEEGATACPDGDPEDLSEDVLGFLSCLGRNHFQELDSFYQSLRECHLLSEEEERAAGQQWVDHGEIAGIQKLVQGNVRFVVQEARRFLHGPLEFGDILGEGVLGLYEASRRYDPSRGNRFLTYAAWWVRQSIFRALSNVGDGVRFPSKLGSAIARYRWYSSKVKDRFGYQVEAADLARDGLFPIAEAKFLQRMHESTEVVPLEECSYERWALPESEIEEHAEAEESKALEVRSALWSLSEREQLILAHHFGLSGMREKTLEEIGQIMTPPVSRERVRQIEVRALESVRTRYPNLRQMLCEFTPFTWVPNLVDCGQEVEDDAE